MLKNWKKVFGLNAIPHHLGNGAKLEEDSFLMQFLTRIAKWIILALISLLACTLVLFLIFLIMDIFGVSGEDVSNNLLDHRILLILLAFASMLVSYFYLYKK